MLHFEWIIESPIHFTIFFSNVFNFQVEKFNALPGNKKKIVKLEDSRLFLGHLMNWRISNASTYTHPTKLHIIHTAAELSDVLNYLN